MTEIKPAMRMWSLAAAQRAIVAGGCLAMAFTQLTTSPATIAFAKSLGGTGLHVGILGALPTGLICMQLFGALVVNQLRFRKPLWLAISLVQRLVLAPAALGPWLWPELPDEVWIWTLIALTTLNHGMLHFGSPLWLSWMGDYLPHSGLNTFWGVRHSSQQWTAAAALLANALFFFGGAFDIRTAFAIIITTGCIAGVADILLFLRVEEPPVKRHGQPGIWRIVSSPFREVGFRSFIRFSCAWHLAAMVGAPFISLYLLEYVGMDLFHVLMLWTLSWVGGALLSRKLGDCAERFGQRPVLVLCASLKSANMIALLFCPRDAELAFWLLAPVFMFDACLNSGISIANNGFMIKNSPRENRAMYLAAGSAFAGLLGGITSVAAGIAITATEGWRAHVGGFAVVNFHGLFALSIVLRIAAAAVAVRIREPQSQGARFVAKQIALETGREMRRLPERLARRSAPRRESPPVRTAA